MRVFWNGKEVDPLDRHSSWGRQMQLLGWRSFCVDGEWGIGLFSESGRLVALADERPEQFKRALFMSFWRLMRKRIAPTIMTYGRWRDRVDHPESHPNVVFNGANGTLTMSAEL